MKQLIRLNEQNNFSSFGNSILLKPYDKVASKFLFQAMGKTKITTKFITMVKMLFVNVEVVINLNDKMTKTFEMRRKVR
jgi:hypothetical protein